MRRGKHVRTKTATQPSGHDVRPVHITRSGRVQLHKHAGPGNIAEHATDHATVATVMQQSE